MKQINLLPKTEQQEFKLHFFSKRLVNFWILVLSSLVILFVLAFATKIYLNSSIQDTQNEINQDNALLNSSDFKDLQNQIVSFDQTIKDINNLQSQHYYWSDALIQLSNLIPGQMQLNNLVLDSTNNDQIVINGQAQTRDEVIALWSNIIKSSYFSNINFPLANLEKPTSANFTYTFDANKDKFNSQ